MASPVMKLTSALAPAMTPLSLLVIRSATGGIIMENVTMPMQRLIMLMDDGGSNSSRHYIFNTSYRLWRMRLALRFESPIIHLTPRVEPYRTSRFSAYYACVTRCYSDPPSTDKRVNRERIHKDGVKGGICILDKVYATGRKVAAGFKESMRIVFDKHLRQWNYTAVPEKTTLAID